MAQLIMILLKLMGTLAVLSSPAWGAKRGLERTLDRAKTFVPTTPSPAAAALIAR